MIIQVIEKLRLFQSLKNEDVLTNFGLSNSLFILIVMSGVQTLDFTSFVYDICETQIDAFKNDSLGQTLFF